LLGRPAGRPYFCLFMLGDDPEEQEV